MGNALPHPASLFGILAGFVILLSWMFSALKISVAHPATGGIVAPVNLVSQYGLHRILTEMITNFTGFAPLGTVLVSLLGIGVAESSGLIGTALRLLVISAPRRSLTFVIVLAGVLSNTASEVGYVLLVPLSAIIFLAVGRHPIAGLAAAFAGVSGGYSANLWLGTVDPLLAGLSEEAARIIDPSYQVNPACNYYFMAASTLLITVAGTWVTERVVVPRLGEYEGDARPEKLTTLTSKGNKGTRLCNGRGLRAPRPGLDRARARPRFPERCGNRKRSAFSLHEGNSGFHFQLSHPGRDRFRPGRRNDPHRLGHHERDGKVHGDAGALYGAGLLCCSIRRLLQVDQPGPDLCDQGSCLAQGLRLGPIPLMLAFILLSALINLSMGSASAKWAIMAPVFVPMFMLLNYSPELVQAAYRVGDSVTNIVSPMMSYFALIVAFMQRYVPRAGIGTVVATMLPYSVVFLVVWMVLLIVWLLLSLPTGPGSAAVFELVRLFSARRELKVEV